MSRKLSAYGRRQQRMNPAVAKAYHAASLLACLRMHRAYSDETEMPGDIEGAADLIDTARKAMLHARSALDGLMRCQAPIDPRLDFSRLKHVLRVSVIRTLQMVYGSRRRDPFEQIDMRALNSDQAHAVETLHEANKALDRAYDRWEAVGGYGLDADGRKTLPEAVELYEAILVNSTPEQMRYAHEQVLLCQKTPLEATV